MSAKVTKVNESKKVNVNEILSKVTTNLKTNAGRNESIYKKEVFDEVENKKNLRAKLRKIAENFAKTIIKEDNESKLKSLIKDFEEFYQSFYLINDYSINSICSNNTDKQTKENYKKMFEKITTNNK